MKFSVLTIFPEMLTGFLEHGIVRRAIDRRLVEMDTVDIRDHANDRHRTTDDRPYGGGDGMLMKPEPMAGAIRQAVGHDPDALTIHLTPQGRVFDQEMARELSKIDHVILICGRYEGIDERVGATLVDCELSIGDYVLTGGEVAAMVVIDAVTRLLPGALGGEHSADTDSFADRLLGHAQYTRPREFEGQAVPEVLLSGNHREIDRWRAESAVIRTFLKRPDLLMGRPLTAAEIRILKKWRNTIDRIIEGGEPNGK